MAGMPAATVLLVDDEEMILFNLASFLEDEGYTVLTAGSSEEALEILAGREVAVAVVDMRLPGMDGNAFIRAVAGRWPHPRFLVHTGSCNYAPPQDLRALGMDEEDVFLKPLLDMGRLAARIRQLVGG